ncbi:MAG: rRNA maturation RNase YbeY [Deferribacterales bacterium]
MKAEIFITDETESGLGEKLFSQASEAVFEELDVEFDECEISLLICDDAQIQELNKEYREKDYATDVLSFPMSDDPYGEGGMLGDIVISLDTAKKQAQEADIALEREISFLFIHGLLHLMGFDHELGQDEEEEMFTLQEEILLKLVKSGKVA